MTDSDKTKTIDGFAYWIENEENGVCYIPLNLCEKIMKLLKEQQEVVRCKDCKYYDYFNGCMSWHDVNSNNDNWYCADGERN